MKIYITRHGETEWNTKRIIQGNLDSPLTLKGIEGAYKLADRLKEVKFDYIITSPLYRAFRTAEIIAQDTNIPIMKDDSLKEINCGEFQGFTFKDVWLEFPNLKNQMESDSYNFIYPGGESLAQFNERVILGFNKIIKDYKNLNILLVGHGGTIRCLTSFILDDASPKTWFNKVVSNCSLTEIDYIADKFNVLKFNDTDHLKNPDTEKVV